MMLLFKFVLIMLDQSMLFRLEFVVALVRAVFGFLPWWVSNGDNNVYFFRHMRNSYVIWISPFLMLNGFWSGSNFMHPSLRLAVESIE